MLLGRDDELQTLRAFVDDPRRASTALRIEGEHGIGRTSLWSAAVDHARSQGRPVLATTLAPADREMGLLAVADLIRQLDPIVVSSLPKPLRASLSSIGSATDARADARALTLALIEAWHKAAEGSPVVVAIDDPVWLDADSARVLSMALRHVADVPIRLVLTHRSDDALPALADAVPPERTSHLPLGGLTDPLISDLVSTHVSMSLDGATAEELVRLAGGNPALAIEVARAIQRREPAVTGLRLPVPRSLREDLLRDRIGALGENVRTTLLAVALSVRPTVELVLRVSGPQARRGLNEAVDAGVLEVVDGTVRFRRSIVGAAVHADADRGQRRAMHRALADAAQDPAARARHLALALDEPDARAATLLEEAAADAKERGAAESSWWLSRHAVRLTPEARTRDRGRRRLAVAQAALAMGDPAGAREAATQAERDDGTIAWEASAFLGDLALAEGDTSAAASRFRSILDSGAAISGEQAVRADLAEAAYAMGDAEAARAAATSATDGGDPDVWRARAAAALARSDTSTARAAIANGLALAPEDGALAARLHALRGDAERAAGKITDARVSYATAKSAFERLGLPHWAASVGDRLEKVSAFRSGAGGGLTDAERRVGALAASGLRNREIAETLYLSVRTVESHLSNIYAKLGVRTRTELVLVFETDGPERAPSLRRP